MGYSKKNGPPGDYEIKLHDGVGGEYVFRLKPPPAGADRYEALRAVNAEEIPIYDWAASVITSPPAGFDDFPLAAAERAEASDEPSDERFLAVRVKEYFGDEAHPDLKNILFQLANAYFGAILMQADVSRK